MMVANSGLNCKNCEMECEGQVTPEVRSELKPKLGLEFDCCDDVFNFYNMCVAKAGFGIQCSTTRTGTLTGEVSLLVVQVERLENVGFVKRDVYNYLRDVRGEVIRHDAELLKEHFLAKQEKNESFYFKMEVDLEGRMGNVFWLDARSRRAYWFFGDVVVFDTMFNTNPYGMVFVPLLGFNNHRQTVLFGCAFLTSETTDSFVWLLEEFKKAMPGEPPKMIITDQDVAKSKAIAITLLTTFHRYCIWHILNKITEKPGIGECVSKMCKCIWGMDTKE
ncbi:hypothetical protein L3X38_004136 [Prunus dulcis]|uniref:MULE transposase domain-containing protein n=1 Tax=Prunus dulcis TaxID=3755 RepID=A0AAD5F2Z6_PRUDU|nr:hypothetical protein L3X38_004136 [Prunus dulcis]